MNRSTFSRSALLFIGLCVSALIQAQISVFHIEPSSVPLSQEGIFYSLPRTVVNIEVVVDNAKPVEDSFHAVQTTRASDPWARA